MIDWFQIARDAGLGVCKKTELTELTQAEVEQMREPLTCRGVDSVNSVNSNPVTPGKPRWALAVAEGYVETLHPEAAHGGDRTKQDAKPASCSFADDQSANTGQAKRTIQRDAEHGENAFPYGASPGGRPLTWTGRVVSLDAWRSLTEWERHGPRGERWNGKGQRWEQGEGEQA